MSPPKEEVQQDLSNRTIDKPRTGPKSCSDTTAFWGVKLQNPKRINIIKWALVLIRLYILITPVLLTVDNFIFTLFWISWALNILLVVKFFYLLCKRGRNYLQRASSVIDIFSTIGVFGFGLAYCIYELSIKDLDQSDALGTFEILWSIASFSHVFGILVRLGNF
jgi:hypothetical protein